MLGRLATLWRAGKVAVDSSRAIAAAKRSWDAGGSLTDVVRAFTDETDVEWDDDFPDRLEEAIGYLADKAGHIGRVAVRFSHRVQTQGPEVLEQAQGVANKTASAALKAIALAEKLSERRAKP